MLVVLHSVEDVVRSNDIGRIFSSGQVDASEEVLIGDMIDVKEPEEILLWMIAQDVLDGFIFISQQELCSLSLDIDSREPISNVP